MFDFLEKLRNKSDRTKKQIAFVTALTLAGLIFVVWLSVIYPDWKYSQDKDAKAGSLEPSPTAAIGATLSQGFSSIGNQFNNIKEAISNFSSQVNYYSSASSTASTTESSQ